MKRFPILIGLALLLVGAADPRPELVVLQWGGFTRQALERIDEFVGEDPETARELGIDYLRGHLLENLNELEASPAAFAEALTTQPLLAGHARYRLALNRYRAGQPEIAAGLLATLLANGPPPSLVAAAVERLTTTVQEGGDCLLLAGWQDWDLPAPRIRQIQAAVIDCSFRNGNWRDQVQDLSRILSVERADDTALRAAVVLSSLGPEALEPSTGLLVGLTFFQHREFQRALPFLVASLESSEAATRDVSRIDRGDVLYALARCHYWLGQFESAIQVFSQAATEETDAEKAARALFQMGRSLALQGDWEKAVASFNDAALAAPTGSWAAAALISALRLEWRQGRESVALEYFQRLRARRSWRISLERAAIFLAVSDLVRERSDRAAAWLDIAQQARRHEGIEIRYWRGRLAELQSDPEVAVSHFLRALAADPLHPLAKAAGRRLRQPVLESEAQARAQRLLESHRTSDLQDAWILLGAGDPASTEVGQRLVDQWRQSSRTRTFLEMAASNPETWRLWSQRPRQPEQVLLALGIAEAMSPSVRAAFPLADTGLALAGSEVLSASGLHRRSLYFAEVVSQRVPKSIPPFFWPERIRQLLYPRPYGYAIAQQARRFGVDPNLLTAIIREESRFDPLAVSAASARGLTQFVWPTAQRLAEKLDLGRIGPTDLHRPEISITLGAAYLAELDRRFAGHTGQVVTAYNAGEEQARLWQAYCFSQEPEEYFSKVGFRQTRDYLEKVLRSRNQYAEIYSGRPEPQSETRPMVSTTGGRVE